MSLKLPKRTKWNAATTLAAIVAAGAIALAAVGSQTAIGAESLAGAWRLDRAASDRPPQSGRRGHGGAAPDGVKHDKRDGDQRGRDGKRPRRLGRYLRIEQTATALLVADSSGALMREIVLGDTPQTKHADDAPVMTGAWQGSSLEVSATAPNGKKHVEVWQVGDDGKTLTITVRREARGDKPAREMKRVYRRTAA
jgi:hypothetical protein